MAQRLPIHQREALNDQPILQTDVNQNHLRKYKNLVFFQKNDFFRNFVSNKTVCLRNDIFQIENF
jgi:ABC-type phosphate transport system ATPase subunit